MTTVRWISYPDEDTKHTYEEHGGLGGFFSAGMRWQDYLDAVEGSEHEDLEAIRQSVVTNKVWVDGGQHQMAAHEYVPLVDEARIWLFSFRAWGDLMAAIWSTELDQDFCYMDFYYLSTPRPPWLPPLTPEEIEQQRREDDEAMERTLQFLEEIAEKREARKVEET